VWHTRNLFEHCPQPIVDSPRYKVARLVVADGRQPVAKVGKARREGGADVAASLLNYSKVLAWRHGKLDYFQTLNLMEKPSSFRAKLCPARSPHASSAATSQPLARKSP